MSADDQAAQPSLGTSLRQRRKNLGLRQDEVADLAQVSERFVREAERDKPTLRLDKLRALLDALGLELTTQLRTTTRR